MRISIVFALLAISMWASNAFVAQIVLNQATLHQVQALQFFGACIVFSTIIIYKKLNNIKVTISFLGGFLGIIGITGVMIFQYIGFKHAPIVQANIIAYSWPVLSVLLLARKYKTLNASEIVLILMAFVSVSYMLLGDHEEIFSGVHLYGYFAAFLSALCMAIYTVYIKYLKSDIAFSLLIGSVVALVLSLFNLSSGLQDVAYDTMLLSIYLGVGPIGLGYIFWSLAVRLDKSKFIVGLSYLTPVFSTFLLFISGTVATNNTVAGGGIALLISAVIAKRVSKFN